MGVSPSLSRALGDGGGWLALRLGPSRVAIGTRVGRRERRAGALVAAFVVALAAPLLPPVPVACTESATGTGIVNREIEGAADAFPAGTKRVYAWFPRAVPRHGG